MWVSAPGCLTLRGRRATRDDFIHRDVPEVPTMQRLIATALLAVYLAGLTIIVGSERIGNAMWWLIDVSGVFAR